MRVEVKNDLKADVGDYVQLSVPVRSLLKLSLLVYFFPIVALMVGAITADAWAASLRLDSTFASILGGCIAMCITFGVLKWLDKRSAARVKYEPRMISILSGKDSHQVGEEA